MAQPSDLLQQPAPEQVGFGLSVEANPPTPAPVFQQREARQQRRDTTSTMDAVQSIYRQDGLVDGLVASHIGRNMTPDSKYNPFSDPNRTSLTEGIHPDFVNELDRAHSPAHAFYIRDRLLQKQKDLETLGDMGFVGNAGRLALGMILPENLLMAAGSMGTSRIVQGARMAQVAKKAAGASPVAAAEMRVGAVAGAALSASKAPAIAAGVAAGVVENAAYEKVRQSVNFEDDSVAVLEAGLIGAAFTAPFAWAGARSSRKIAHVATQEHEILRALKAVDEGADLTPDQGKLINETHKRASAIQALEDGKLSPEEFTTIIDGFSGPVESPNVWMERFGDRVKSEAEELMAGYLPGANQGLKAKPKPSAAMRAQMDARVARETANFNKVADQVEATPEAPAAAPEVRNNQMELALRTAVNRDKMAKEAAAKPQDLEALLKAGKRDADKARKSAFEAAESADQAKKAADQERMVRDRELTRMMAADPDHVLQAPAKAPAEPAAATNPSLEGDGAPVATEPSQAPESFIGQEVTWVDRKSGDMMAGTPERISPTGKLLIRDEDGALRAVDHTELTEFVGEVPHGFIASGSIGAGQISMLNAITRNSTAMSTYVVPGTGGKVKVPTRFDLYNMLNKSPSETVRTLADRLIKDPVANKVHGAQAWTASEMRSHQMRVINGEFHRTAKEALIGAIKGSQVPVWGRRQFATDFYEATSIYARVQDDRVLAKLPQAAWGSVKAAAAAQRKALDRHLGEAQKAGVLGAAGVTANDAYVNRIWRADKIRTAMELHGKDNVYQLLADAMTGTSSKGPLTGDVVKAKRFLGTVMGLEFSPAMGSLHLAGRDMHTLRGELAAMRMTPDQIDTVIDTMFESKATAGGDAGQASNLRFRFDLDETMVVKTQAGELSITDLIENDARILMDTYGRSMAGHTSLAKIGIPSQAAWAQKLKMVKDEVDNDPGLGGQQLARDVQWLEDIHANILGRPMSMSDFTFTSRTAAAFRGYTRSIMLGQLGISAAFEMKQAIGIMGVRAFMTQMPSFGSFIHALRRGHMPDAGLARDIMHISGWGQEKAASYARAREIDEGLAADVLTKLEKGANEASHAVDILSGNASFTSLTRQLSGMMAAQKLHDFATGVKTMSKGQVERMKGQGLEANWLTDTMRDLKDYSVAPDGVLKQIRHEDWKAAEPETYEAFQLFVDRQVRDAIQDHDLGETMPFMHSTLGKMFGELKTFFLVAHAKNMVKNMHYMDGTTLQVLLIGMMGEAMAYSVQQAINNPDKLEERLTPDSIGRAVMFRMAALGFMPMLVETGYNIVSGGDTLVQPGTTANTDNRSFLKPPSLTVANRLMRLPQTLVGGALGTDTTTRSEAKDAWESFPGSRLIGARGVGDWIADSFPKSDPEKLFSR